MPEKLLLIDLVGLTPRALQHMPLVSRHFDGAQQVHLQPPLPAVTCTSQATLTTGAMPAEHGIVSNGWYFEDAAEVRFWMRSDRLVGGEKIWQTAKSRDSKVRVANVFWRYCTHADCDVTVTERPTYWAHGRKSPDIYTNPPELRDQLVEMLGEFPLFRFWGPATSIAATDWIVDATIKVIDQTDPHLTLAYLPHLDYDLQKFGPNSPEGIRSIKEVDASAARLIEHAKSRGREIALLSEYGITDVQHPVFINRVLRQAGYLAVQKAQNGELLEPGASRAFAACSHQVAHVYVADPADVAAVAKLLKETDGIERVLSSDEIAAAGLGHPRSGQLVAIAASDAWFAYHYWLEESLAPDFARCVAIHDKPGHDPGEMFLGSGGKPRVIRRLLQTKLGFRVPFDVISTDANLIRGSHGRLPDDSEQGPMMLTTWSHGAADAMHMTEVKELLLSRLLK